MNIHRLIDILSSLANDGVSDVYAVDDEIGVSELKVVNHNGTVTIEHVNCFTNGKIEE